MDSAGHRQLHALTLDNKDSQQATFAPSPQRRRRTTACQACKKRRSKCQGDQPCVKCVKVGTVCVFDQNQDRRRKFILRQTKEELDSSEILLDKVAQAFSKGENAQLQLLLSSRLTAYLDENLTQSGIGSNQESADSFSPGVVQAIRNSGQEECSILQVDESAVTDSGSIQNLASSSSLSVGSLDEVDTVREDVNQNLQSRATGYIGKNSELAWMHNLDNRSLSSDRQNPTENRPLLPSLHSIIPLSYFLDEHHISNYREANPHVLPTRAWCDRLIEAYFHTIDPSFPLIDRSLFISQYEQAFSQTRSRPSKKWLAVLNIILAIGTKYCRLSRSGPDIDIDDGDVLFQRSMTLSSNDSVYSEHADIQQVQIESLAAIYYLASAQINRSWKMAGVAARSAIALGLNQRAIGDKINAISKETRCRIWWSIFSLEHQVSVLTGRASCLDYRSCRVYPPSPIEINYNREGKHYDGLIDEACSRESLHWTLHGTQIQLQHRLEWFQSLKPTRFLYFFHLIDLQMIAHAVLNQIYSADVYRDGWEEITIRMSSLEMKYDLWLRDLRRPFNFMAANGAFRAEELSQDQLALALNYFSSKIILHRPCQAPLKLGEVENQLPRSSYRQKGALSCLRAALAVISTLPEKPDMEWLYKMMPWLNILHFIVQAVAVLLIHITMTGSWEKNAVSLNCPENETAESFGPTVTETFLAIKKAMCWIVEKANKDCSAQRALNICTKVVHQFDPTNGWGLTDMHFLPRPNVEGGASANLLSLFPISTEQYSSTEWGPDGEKHESAGEETPLLSLDPMLLATSYLDLNMI